MKPDLSKYSYLLATVVIAGGILVLAGWQFNIDLLKRPVTGTAAMNPTSALCFIFSGISFLLFRYRHRRAFVIASVLLAVFVIFIAVLMLADPIFQTGPDRILFSGKLLSVHLSGMRTARMAQNAAVNFLLTGIVLVMLHSRSNTKKTVLQLIAAFIALMALFSILGYIYNAPEFRGMLIQFPMALPCAILFFILSFSFLLVYSKEGIAAELTHIYTGSVVARALLPFAILVPILLGYLNLLAHRYALFSTELGLMSLILSIIGIFIILIWYTARILNIRDKANKEAEAIAQDSEMQIKTIFNAAPDAVVVINEEGRIIQWNPRAELMFGWTFHEVMGKLLSETIIPERYREAHRKGLARYLDTGKATILNTSVEIQASTKDNKELDVALSISPTIVKGKQIFIGFIRDVSEHKKAQERIRESREIFSTLFYKSPVMNAITDTSTGEYIDVNDSYASFCGLQREQMIGKTAMQLGLFDPDDRAGVISEIEKHKSLRNKELRIYIHNEAKWISMNIDKIMLFDRSCYLAAMLDITDRKKGEDKFRRLLELAPDAIVIVNNKGVIQLVNAQAEKVFGYSKDELVGQQVEMLMPLRYDKTHHQHRTSYFSGPKVRQMGEGLELFGRKKDGNEFPVEISLSPLETDEGLLVSAAIRDITERKKAEAKFKGLLESAPDAIVIVNEEGIIQLVNAQTLKLFNYSKEELTGQRVELLMPFRYGDTHGSHRGNYFKSPKVRQMGSGFDLLGRKKNGEEFPVEISLSPLETEDGLLVSAAIRDISEKKRLEHEIKEANVNLEAKVIQRTAELERKNRDLEQFAYVASHDLQEPLRTTSSFVHVLQEKYQGKLDEEANQILEYMVQGSERMKTLIKDLLDYSRIGRKIELLDIDCNTILKEVVADLDTAFREAEAMIMIDPLPQLRGYPTELKLLFQNLISNALKFRRKNEPLVINISAKQNKNYWQFSVTDNGIGINEKFKERIFIIFQRLHVQSEYDGSGIGLAHCKKIVELHNGAIWVESVPDKGSTFYFTIQLM